MHRQLLGFIILMVYFGCTPTHSLSPQRPKLVVGIVVDQMKQEYFYRYAHRWGKGGLNKLLSRGFVLHNAHYTYVPTYTGPGHASIYTGTTPSSHGIIGNQWYDRRKNKIVNCVEDTTTTIVGVGNTQQGKSPHRLLATTLTDELQLATQYRSKIISLSLKDRGAILPAGHAPNGVFWLDWETGNFVTSSYYTDKLPSWVQLFNERKLANYYLQQTWEPLYPISTYENSGPDSSAYEILDRGETSVFPYVLSELQNKYEGASLLAYTPWGNTLLTELALTAIEEESLGNDQWTDFLAISYSSTDILGHAVGPYAVELEDMYLRLDQSIELLIKTLDEKIGKENYLMFLTSDHGVAPIEGKVKQKKLIPSTYQHINFLDSLHKYLANINTPHTIEAIINKQVYLSPCEQHAKRPINECANVREMLKESILNIDGVAEVFTRKDLITNCNYQTGMQKTVRKGFNLHRSGDISFVMQQGWVGSLAGTTHGSGYTYDTHVPVILYGHNIKTGMTVTRHSITDVAPTLSLLLKIGTPSNSTGNPIAELWE